MRCSDYHRQHADARPALLDSLSQMLGSGMKDNGEGQERKEENSLKSKVLVIIVTVGLQL